MKTFILAGLLGLTLVGCGKKEEIVFSQNDKFLSDVKTIALNDGFTFMGKYTDEQLLHMGDVICTSIKKSNSKDVINVLLEHEDPQFRKAWMFTAVSAVSNLCPETKESFETAIKERGSSN